MASETRATQTRRRGPLALFAAWCVHDIEEALTFPSTFDALAGRTGVERLRISRGQSWGAVGLMGVLVAFACWRGALSDGRSHLYRATAAGLEAHVSTHLAASLVQRRYTAGVATAVPVMLPGALAARSELRRAGRPLRAGDYARGAALLLPAALASQAVARMFPSRQNRR
ncbi:HXXEE domain-containing protein [Leucobacter sp. NPDC015123]|uniref:HXXEE domain-containing protein n=1 Tax=Leucobacter sp. NPDC015123 TaxID=3364129 RepID=UPI0036F49D33